MMPTSSQALGGPATRRALSATEVVTSLTQLEGWSLSGDGHEVAISKGYAFTSFHETMAFVNAVAYVAHRLDHHPELLITPCSCTVRWRTHDVGGISRRDFEAAAQVDALLS